MADQIEITYRYIEEEHTRPTLKKIEDRTNGLVKFTAVGGPWVETVEAHLELLGDVVSGKVGLNQVHTSYCLDDLPLSGIFGMPFLFPSCEALSAVGWQLLEKYMLKTEYKDVKVLWMFSPGLLELHSVYNPIHKLEDLDKVKVQMRGDLPSAALEALGGCPVPCAREDVLEFLKIRLLDAEVMNWEGIIRPDWNDVAVVKYHTNKAQVWSTGIPIIMNLDIWNKLPSDVQNIFEEESGFKRSHESGIYMDNLDKEALKKVEKMDGHEIYHLPAEERERWAAVVNPIITRWADGLESRGLPGRAIVEDASKLAKDYIK